MAKKQLNKMIMLPLFLAGVTLVSAGVLTGVNLLTAPFIANNELNKKYEGYKQILEIDSFDEFKELDVSAALNTAGIKFKKEFYINDATVGVVYDGEIKGWENGLVFQVGFKDNVYAGFNVISSNETPGIGADYLKLVHDRIKGLPITAPVLIDDDGTYTGVTAPFTGEPLKEILEKCALDYASGGTVEPDDPDEHIPAALDDLKLALNNDRATSYNSIALDDKLTEDGIVYVYEMLANDTVVGYVYEALVKGFKPDLQFLVSLNDGVYTGFHIIASKETPTYGGVYLDALNGALVGLEAGSDVTVLLPDLVGITKTREPIEKALESAGAHYLSNYDEVKIMGNLKSALNDVNVDGFVKHVSSGELLENDINYVYFALQGDEIIGYVYEALVRGFKPNLQFMVGLHEGKYKGFHVVASSETPTYGGIYLDALNDVLVGLDANSDVTVLLPDLVGITKTREPIEKALGAASAHYLANGESSLAVDHLKAALNVEDVTTFTKHVVTNELQEAGIIARYVVGADVVYEALVNGFKPNLQFMVGFSAGKYVGFHIVKSGETPTYGGVYLNGLNDALVGKDASEELVLFPDLVGITRTREPVEKALEAAAAHYVGGLK